METRILVVDDELGIVKLCERILEKEEYSVRAYTDPKQALKYIVQNPIDLLLVDIRMPEISGFDLIAHTKQHQPDAAILVMTGFGTVETAIQVLRQGVDGLLLKPFETSAELVQAVAQALSDSQKKRDAARIQALRPLFDITETFLTETNPERLLDLILTAACGHLHCNNAAFYYYENNDLIIASKRGIILPEEKSDPLGGQIARTDAQGIPFLVNSNGPGDASLQKSLTKAALGSVLSAPISRQNVRGVLFAGREAGQPSFREVEWEMFLLLARQSAVAMENARLYEELREYVRRVEDSQQALVRAEKVSAAGRLTASIAHEINNPLQAVQNCLHLASRKELSEKKRREYLKMANQELDRLMATVQRMLGFYRPGGVERQNIDVVELIRRVIDLLASQLDARGVRVTTNISTKIPPINAVSSQLEQVFINLILNAYDAMPEGGELRITARPSRDMVEIVFQDTGPGVPDELRNRIFEPFISTKEGGTGLGLSVSYGIVSAHGGSLDLLSDRSGACFRLLLPIRSD
jgi:signal transduction histidine kinase/CheY-like chemotaxis protein